MTSLLRNRAQPLKVKRAPNAPVLRPLPELTFPELLPVSGLRLEIAQAIRDHPVVIVCGETGSGKTTQLPKICALAGRGQAGLIGHTQPRRLAATSVARRIAEELGSPLGTHVGYKIRFNEKLSDGATFKIMTDGILLAESQTDLLLSSYDTIIVDEAHERSLNIDFLLGYLKQLIEGPRRGQLRLVITSATIDSERFAAHFGAPGRPAPIIEVSGRLYPVEIRYQDPTQPARRQDDTSGNNGNNGANGSSGSNGAIGNNGDDEDETDLPSRIEAAIDELWAQRPGDVLVFLPGEREIRDTHEHLRRAHARRTALGPVEILPLYSRLSAADQDRVFKPGNGRRIVLATNVAETSLTVPGIRYVVDTGLARVKRYRYRSRVEQLQIEAISQAAANQRSGRCGRISDGVCIRLYSEIDFQGRPRFTDPEVLRSSLATVILRMKALHLTDVDQFPFLDPPPRKAIVDGFALLHELNAVDESQSLTDTGRALARLPLDPKIGRMLLAAKDNQSLAEVLVVAAALTCQDPRERPPALQQAADQQHRRFADDQSDFASLLKLWAYWRDASEHRSEHGESNRQLAQRFEREFLSVRKLREWTDVHSQLSETVTDMRWRVNETPASYEQIHVALLAGLLGSLGTRAPEDTQYTATHAVKFLIHPSSTLVKKAPRWLMAAEWIDTGRLYARMVARIEAPWIERVGAHLLAKSWSDPVWSKNAGQLVAMERGVLYGLPIYLQRRVMHGAREPALSRERLIRDGLIDGDLSLDPRLAFIEQNRRLIAEVQKLEQKIRRPELLVNEDFLFDWFDARLPSDVWSLDALAQWWKSARTATPKLLQLSRDELIRKDSEGVDSNAFPKCLVVKGLELPLAYQFDPGSAHDGVTLLVPLHLLNQLEAAQLEWLVPGMLRDKVNALVKSLPQKIRRHLVPIPEFVQGFSEFARTAEQDRGLVDALIDYIQSKISIRPQAIDFKLEQVPAHLFMNLKLLDDQRGYVAESRSLAHLKTEFGSRAQSAFQAAFASVRGRIQAAPRAVDGAQKRPPPVRLTRPVPGPLPLQSAHPQPTSGTPQQPASVTLPRSGTLHTEWSFGDLPEMLELESSAADGEATLIGYPALVDRNDAVELCVFDQPEVAARTHHQGLRRLFLIALKEPIKYFCKTIPEFTAMSLAFARFGGAEELRVELVLAMLDRTCMAEPLPLTRTQFEARAQEARSRLNLVGQELARTVAAILSEHGLVQKRLAGIRGFPEVVRDIEAQLAGLLGRKFISKTPPAQLPHVLRYLKAVVLRIDKLRADPLRDQQKMREANALIQGYRKLYVQRAGQQDSRLADFFWLLEELRVSLYAQELRTPAPVSVKRLERHWAQILSLS